MKFFNKKHICAFVLLALLAISNNTQSQNSQGISIFSEAGVSEYDLMGVERIGDDNWNQFGFYYGNGLSYFYSWKKIEIGVSASFNRHQTIFKAYTEYMGTFKPDSFVFIGTTGTEVYSLYYAKLSPFIKYNIIEKEKYRFYIGLGFGINHIFKEKRIFDLAYDLDNNKDTTYYFSNENLDKMCFLVASASLSSGLIFDLSDKLQLQTEVFYSSFLHNNMKESNSQNIWNRHYNTGLRFSLRYKFGKKEE